MHFVKPHKPGFVNSKGKEERTCFIPYHKSYLYFSHFLSLSHIYVFTHTFSIFLSVSLVLFYCEAQWNFHLSS